MNRAKLKFPEWFNATGASVNVTDSTITGFTTQEISSTGLDTELNDDSPIITWASTTATLFHSTIDRVYQDGRFSEGSRPGGSLFNVSLTASSTLYAYDTYLSVDYSNVVGLHNELHVDDPQCAHALVPRTRRERRQRVEPNGPERGRKDPALHGPDHERDPAERTVVRELPGDGDLLDLDGHGRGVLQPVPGRQRGRQQPVEHLSLRPPGADAAGPRTAAERLHLDHERDPEPALRGRREDLQPRADGRLRGVHRGLPERRPGEPAGPGQQPQCRARRAGQPVPEHQRAGDDRPPAHHARRRPEQLDQRRRRGAGSQQLREPDPRRDPSAQWLRGDRDAGFRPDRGPGDGAQRDRICPGLDQRQRDLRHPADD